MKRSAAKFPPLPVLPKPPPLHAASSQTLDAVVCNQSVTSPAPASASHADLAEFVSMPLESPPVPVVSQPPEVASKHNLHDLPVAQPPDRSRNSQNPQAIAQEGTSMPFASNTPIVPSGSATVAEITTPSTHVRPGVLVPQSCSALSPRRNEMGKLSLKKNLFVLLIESALSGMIRKQSKL
jgi:hypothetical protein